MSCVSCPDSGRQGEQNNDKVIRGEKAVGTQGMAATSSVLQLGCYGARWAASLTEQELNNTAS